MKQDPELFETFQRWNPQVVLPKDFQSQVWGRIAARQKGAEASSVTRLWLDWAESFPRLTIGVPCLALVLALAIMGGRIQSQQETEAERLQWQDRYLETIDPYAKVRSHQAL